MNEILLLSGSFAAHSEFCIFEAAIVANRVHREAGYVMMVEGALICLF